MKWFKSLGLTTYHKSWNVIEDTKVDDKNCMIVVHPHGVMPFGLGLNINNPNNCYKNTVGLMSRVGFILPFAGLILRLWGL